MPIDNVIYIPKPVAEGMRNHAVSELPNECCGVLLGRSATVGRFVPVRNVQPAPDTYFMDPGQQIEIFEDMEKKGEALLGIYHSHPGGPPRPSGPDLRLAFHPESAYLIISLEKNFLRAEIRAFVLRDNRFHEITIHYR